MSEHMSEHMSENNERKKEASMRRAPDGAIKSAAADLDAAEAATDEDRARLLEELYEALESELERDGGNTGAPRL
jgi:hypothetical protein